MTAFDTMKWYYRERCLAIKEWKEKGGKVLGYLCNNTPEEIIYAAGFLPIRLTGDPLVKTTIGDQYMEDHFCPFVRSIFDLTLRGVFNYFDAIVIPHACDAIIRMAKYLVTVKELDDIKFPDMYWIDMPHSRTLKDYEYYLGRVIDFRTKMEKLAGEKISDSALWKAIEAYNKGRTLLQEIVRFRWDEPHKISGTEALQIIGSGLFMPRHEHNKLLEEFLQEELINFPTKSGVRVFVSGSCMDSTALTELIESCGAIVVGDDTCMSDRYAETMIDLVADPIEAITRRYLFKSPCPRVVSMKERINYFKERLQKVKPQAVIFYFLRWCDTNMWDYVSLAGEVKKLGIPYYYCDMQEYHLANPESLRTRFEALIESAGGAK